MKNELLLAVPLGLGALLVLGFCLRKSEGPHSKPSAGAPPPVHQTAVSRAGRDSKSDLPRKPVRAASEEAFWMSAKVADPASPRLPSTARLPARQSNGATSAQLKSEIAEAEKLPSDPGSARQLNDLVLKLYNLSPDEAVTWLNNTERFKELAPAVVAIAANLADEGDVEAAISSLESLDNAELQLSAMLEIYRTQVRSGRYSRSDFAAAGFSPQEIEFIFLGD